MKKRVFLILLAMLMTSADASYGSDDDRRAWWNERRNGLREERAAFTGTNPPETRLREALDRDIRRAEATLASFERGAPSAATAARISPERIRAIAAEIAPPIITLHYLNHLLERHDDAEPAPALRRAVEARCAERLAKADPAIAPEDVRRLMSDHIRAGEWRLMAWELFMEGAITERDARAAALTARIADDAIEALSRRKFTATEREARELIVERALLRGAQATSADSARIAASTALEIFSGRLVRMHLSAAAANPGDRQPRPAWRAEVESEQARRAIAMRAIVGFFESLAQDRGKLPNEALGTALSLVSAQNRRIAVLAKRIDAALAIDPADQRFLDRASLTRLRDSRRQVRGATRRLTSHAGLAMQTLTRRHAQASVDAHRADLTLRERLAQGEIESLLESLTDLLGVYRTLNRAEGALARYQDTFDTLQAAASEGKPNPGLDCALQSGSLISAVADFNKDEIAAEHRVRMYLRKAITQRFSQASQLSRTHSQKRITTKNMLTPEIAAEVQRTLARERGIRIASWRMDESNIAEVDRKAVEHLRILRDRQAWRAGPAQRSGIRAISVPEAGLTLSLPPALVERAPLPAEAQKGVIRSFSTPDGKGVIYISRPERRDGAPEDVTGLWLAAMGSTAVSDRWGTQEARDYYWTLSRDRRARVMETMTVSGAQGTVIISGVTARSRYNFFKQHIDAMFKSVKF